MNLKDQADINIVMSFNMPPSEPKKLPGLPGLPGLPKQPGQEAATGANTPMQPLPSLPGKAPTGIPGLPVKPASVQPSAPVQTPVTPRFTQNPPNLQPAPVQAPQPQQEYYTPPVQQQPYADPTAGNPQPNFSNSPFSPEEEEEEPSKGFRKKSQSTKTKKRDTSKTSAKKSQYTGRRKNVIYARVGVFGLAAILMIAGAFSFLPKSSGLTASDKPLIISAVRENLNFTDFPRAAGEGFALAFSTTYLNFDPENDEPRYEALKAYVDPAVLTEIQPREATAEELALAKETVPVVNEEEEEPSGVDMPVSALGTPSNKQVVTDGPYLVGSQMFKGGSAALFTVMSEVNNENWVYMQIPMYYSETTGGLSVSSSITFSPTIPSATVPSWEKSTTWNTTDKEIASSIEADMGSYLQAWAASNDTDIQRFLVKEDGKITATKNAVEGLDGKLIYVGLDSLVVEGKEPLTDESSSAERADFNTREADVTVNLIEPTSGLVYTQTYRVVLEYVNQDWFVQDINNISTQLDRDAIIQKEAEEAASSDSGE